MTGLCKRITLLLVLIVAGSGPALANLTGGEVAPADGTVNSIYNFVVRWTPDQPPNTEPWATIDLPLDRLDVPSPWTPNPSYHMIQPDPSPTVFDETSTQLGLDHGVDLIDCEYVEIPPTGNLTLSKSALAIKAVWADRWQRKDLYHHSYAFTPGTVVPRAAYDPPPMGGGHVFVSYYVSGKSRVVVQNLTLPCEFTVYKYPVQAGWTQLAINPSILGFDPDTEGMRSAGMFFGPSSLLGIYDNPTCTGANYFGMLNTSTYVVYLAGTVPDGVRYLYVKVSTYAIDGVWTVSAHGPADINYYYDAGDNPGSYDPEFGEIILGRDLALANQKVYVTYRYVRNDKVTVAQVPIVNVQAVTLLRGSGGGPVGANFINPATVQFDGITGRISLDTPLPPRTQGVLVRYESVDMNATTNRETWVWNEGGTYYPIVRESDDREQRYAGLQPDVGDTHVMESSTDGGFFHGVDRLDPESLSEAPAGSELATLIAGRAANPCWLRKADPDVPNDVIITKKVPVLVIHIWLSNGDDWAQYATVDTALKVITIDAANPIPDEVTDMVVEYYFAGTNMVLVPATTPMPCTVRSVNLNNLYQPRSKYLRINRNLLYFDPDPERWRGAALSASPTDGYNVLGVFDNEDLQGWNYWTPGPGKVQFDVTGAAVLELNCVPPEQVGRLFVKVSSYGIDAVRAVQSPTAPNLYPGGWYDTSATMAFPPLYDGAPPLIGITEVHLARPLPAAGAPAWVTWRPLSSNSVSPARGPVMCAPRFIVAGVDKHDKILGGGFNVYLNPENEIADAIFPLTTRNLGGMSYHVQPCVGGNNSLAVYVTPLDQNFNAFYDGLGRFTFQPMYPAPPEPFTFRLAASQGLNMRSVRQQPKYDIGDQDDPIYLRDPRFNPVDYAPAWISRGLVPLAHTVTFMAATPAGFGDPPAIQWTGPVTATVHSSNRGTREWDEIDYGSGAGNVDVLSTYPGGSWPQLFGGPDPLITVTPSPVVPENKTRPDDGSSSTTFEFRVRYTNVDNLPPRPWLGGWTDEFDFMAGRPNPPIPPTGVVLYLDLADVFDLSNEHRHEAYRPHFMRPETVGDANWSAGVNFYYRLQPCDVWWIQGGSFVYPPTPEMGNAYISLMVGSYHYFFGCTDDSLGFDIGMVGDFQLAANAADWGAFPPFLRHETRSSTFADPSMPRTVVDEDGRPWLPRDEGRRYSDSGIYERDNTIFVNRISRVPGLFEGMYFFQYPLACTEHPEVTVALSGFGDRDIDGFGRFYGTIQPFRRAVNPEYWVPWQPGGFGHWGARMETCGATTSTTLTFKTRYFQRDNRPPLWIKVFINNTSIKIIDSRPGAEMKPENGGYVGYTMQPSTVQPTQNTQTPPWDYRLGVDYEFKTQLPAGPHTYFFMANDGIAPVLLPARPNEWDYTLNYNDWWVPAYGAGTGDPEGYDNNYFPGPYINHPCELSQPSVTPATGLQGQEFVYRVFYKDADYQRPFQTRIYIETGTDKGVIAADMVQEDPNATDDPAIFSKGLWYILDTATLESFSLATGVRHYRFEFIDDWGRQTDTNDQIKGEVTKLPASGGWIDGPVIGQEVPPTLRFGKVESTDGTANGATLWKFSVSYKDLNNDPPKFVTLYIGRLMPDGETIKWDSGHDMAQAIPSDMIYTDGCEFMYQTRLAGPEKVGDPSPTYYYAFEASDGVYLAVWVPDLPGVDENARSESAGCLLQEELLSDDQVQYRSSKSPLVGTLASAPVSAGILIDPVVWWYQGGDLTKPIMVSREDTYVVKGEAFDQVTVTRYEDVDPAYLPAITEVVGVYLKQDLSGTDYFHADDGSPGTYDGVLIGLPKPLPAGTDWVWIKYRHTRNDYHVATYVPESPTVIARQSPVDPIYLPDIWEVLAVYDNYMLTGTDYYHGDDGTPGSYDLATRKVTLARALPEGTTAAYVKYRMPKYTLDRWTGVFTFDRPQHQGDIYKADYFFATKFDVSLGMNVPPILSNAKLTPMVGTSNTDFIYTINYQETEGPNGQAPEFVRVVIDGAPYDMLATVTGTPSYRSGVTYRYIAKLGSGAHNYYFAASDGASVVTVPPVDPTSGQLSPFLGPWVNDPPILSAGAANPNPPTGTITTAQPVDYTVTFTDPDGDAALSGTPIVYVDNPDETPYGGSVAELVEDVGQPGKYRSIRVLDSEGNTPDYAPDQFGGKLLQFNDGAQSGRVYLIASNTADSLKLMTDDLAADGITVGTTFAITALQMFKEPPSQQNYAAGVIYKLTVPQLSEGRHKFHFKAASIISPPPWVGPPWNTMTQSAWVRFPIVGDIDGPNVSATPPGTNHVPVLYVASGDSPVSPWSGKSMDPYDFYITYKDVDGDPPRYHEGVLGYVRLVFETVLPDGTHSRTFVADMRPEVPENIADPAWYKEPRRFTFRANGLSQGNHKFHFESSDGWARVRWPELAQGGDETANDPVVEVNVKATLTEMAIVPPTGDPETTFSISVKYSDLNNHPPIVESGREQVWVEIDGTLRVVYLTRNPADTDFLHGVTYSGTVSSLPAGTHTTAFKAKDSLGELTVVSGPSIQVAANQYAPVLASQKVFNKNDPDAINSGAAGGTLDTFRYEVTYSDRDGNKPLIKKSDSTVVEGVELYIDGRLEAIVSLRTAGGDYKTGVTYYYEKAGNTYQAGDHTYYFKATDGISTGAHSVQTGLTRGPTIVSATISLTRTVQDAGSGAWQDRDPKLGETVRVRGVLRGNPAKPIPASPSIVITVARPDGSGETFTLVGTAETVDGQTQYWVSFDRVPMINSTATRTWTVTAKWEGNEVYKPGVTQTLRVNVKGPTRVVATQDMSQPVQSDPAVDMVCMPLEAPNHDVGTLFGYGVANLMQIVKWDPGQRMYLRYGETAFPPVYPGSAVWIYPNAQYPSESVDPLNPPWPVDPDYPVNLASRYRLLKPFGRLWDQRSSCEVALRAGWNQFGSPYLASTELGRVRVSYQGQIVSLDQAAQNGWIRNYAWMWDPAAQTYRLVHATRPDAYARTLDPWRGYWIRSFVDCSLVVAAPVSSAAVTSRAVEDVGVMPTSSLPQLDEPPPAPVVGR